MGRAGAASEVKRTKKLVRDVYGESNEASDVTNIGSTVASGRPGGWSFATVPGTGNTQGARRRGVRQRYERLQYLNS